jgi:hypothetical protein
VRSPSKEAAYQGGFFFLWTSNISRRFNIALIPAKAGMTV